MLLLIGILTVTTSCGGGSTSSQQASRPPAPQSGTATVQASGGDLNHNISIAVTVN